MNPLSRKHVLVTGGATGIGAAIALALARENARVTILGRRREQLEARAATHRNIWALVADVTDEAEVAAAFNSAVAKRGPPSIVIANAGAAESARFAQTTLEQFDRMIAVNLTGVFLTLREAIRAMADAGWGRLIVIASIAGLRGHAYVAPYSAAKHGAVGLVRSLAIELANTGITVNAICPGYTATPMFEESVSRIVKKTGRTEAQARKMLADINPDGRLVQPMDIVDEVLKLCLPLSDGVTGQAIQIPKGQHLG